MTNEVPNPGWLIGTICYMDQEKIRLRASRSDFSDRMLDGEPRHLNGLNQYLFSYLSISTKIIFRVTSVEEAERPYSDQPSSRFSTSYIFTAVPIGEIEGSSYVPGVVDLPMVGSNVYACDESILKRVFCVREGVEIGSLAGYDSVRPTFDIDSLFSGHLAILGNTGSGKSSTARLLLDRAASLLDAEDALDADPDSSSSICTAIMTFSRAAVTAARDESALMSTTSRPESCRWMTGQLFSTPRDASRNLCLRGP